MEKIHTILKKHFKTPLPLLALYAAVGFLVVAGIYFVYGGGSGCGGSHVHSRMLSHNGDRHPAADGKQTVCPVMVMSIDKNIFTEYKGTKVYFCCPACKPEFEKDPGKYIDRLPQFKNVEKDKIWQALGSEKYISKLPQFAK